MQRIFYLLFTFIVAQSYSQNSIITYDFGSTPQALMLNPSYDMGAQYHLSIPLLGSLKTSIESSGMSAYDLFAKNSIPFQDKIKKTVYQLTTKDFLLINQRMDFFNVGQRLNKDTYLSYGMYLETDLYSTLPVNIIQLFFEGTTFANKQYKLDGFNMQVNLLSVYHIGLQKKLSKKINIGGRLKIYNNAAGVSFVSPKGSFQTDFTNNGEHSHSLTGIDVSIKTSGFPLEFDNDGKYVENKEYIKGTYWLRRLFAGGGLGLGVDLGLTYKIKRNLTLSTSINDLGILFNSKTAQKFSYKGDYTTDAITYEYDSSNPLSYLDTFKEDFDKHIPLEVSDKSFISLRPFQVHSMITYSLGVNRGNKCNYYRNIENSAANKIGAMLYAQYRPEQIIYDANLFYERNFGNFLYARLNYTLNNYSYSNVGLSVATQLGKFNMFVGINNILSLSNLAKSNNIALQFGINIVSKKSKRY
jgi:hypothetical protein